MATERQRNRVSNFVHNADAELLEQISILAGLPLHHELRNKYIKEVRNNDGSIAKIMRLRFNGYSIRIPIGNVR